MSAERLTWKRRPVAFKQTRVTGGHQRCLWLFLVSARVADMLFVLIVGLDDGTDVTPTDLMRLVFTHRSEKSMSCGTAVFAVARQFCF